MEAVQVNQDVVRKGAKGRVPSRFGATALRGVVVESSMSSPTRKYWGQPAGYRLLANFTDN